MARALERLQRLRAPRTVAGVARSLGAPIVAVRPPRTGRASSSIVVVWELSWYRFEVDLSDEGGGVRRVGQGTELTELEADEQAANAVADERGALHLRPAGARVRLDG